METCTFSAFNRLLKKQLSDRFQGKVFFAVKPIKIIPNNLEQFKAEHEAFVLEYYNEYLPSPTTFQQEFKLWKRYWENKNEKPKSLSQSVSVISEISVPNRFCH